MKSVFDYEGDIFNLHNKLFKDPDNVDLQKTLSSRLKSWSTKIAVAVEVANNEKYPWSASEIGYKTVSMQTKEESGFNQVGDYVAHFKGGSVDSVCNTVVERKGGKKGQSGANDFYGTFMDSYNRDRFYREHLRFKRDFRFRSGKLIVFAECSFLDFLYFNPQFIGKQYNVRKVGASQNSRLATVASLFERNVPVFFAGSREKAAETYHYMINQNLIKYYYQYLNLEPVEYVYAH